MAKKPEIDSVVAAVTQDLDRIRMLAPEIADSAEALAALALARELDLADNSATSKSMCAKALADLMTQVRAAAPDKKEGDSLDDLAARRAARRDGSSAAKAAARS